jgi:hypothetical protein
VEGSLRSVASFCDIFLTKKVAILEAGFLTLPASFFSRTRSFGPSESHLSGQRPFCNMATANRK